MEETDIEDPDAAMCCTGAGAVELEEDAAGGEKITAEREDEEEEE